MEKEYVGFVLARSPCCNRIMKETLFLQSGNRHSGERTCLYCMKIVQTWDKEKQKWIDK